jgi:hypothetical protein
VLGLADLVAGAAGFTYMGLRQMQRAADLAYTFAVATAVTGLTMVTSWLFNTRPAPHTLPTLIGSGVVFALTVCLLTKLPPDLRIAIGALPLFAFALLTLFAIAI